MSYKQLTFEQRVAIRAYLQIGLARYQIAQQLGVYKATISRELRRNTGLKGYRLRQSRSDVAVNNISALDPILMLQLVIDSKVKLTLDSLVGFDGSWVWHIHFSKHFFFIANSGKFSNVDRSNSFLKLTQSRQDATDLSLIDSAWKN